MTTKPMLLGAELRGGNDIAMTIFRIPVLGVYLAPLIYLIAPPFVAASVFAAVAGATGLSEVTAMTCTLLFLAGCLVCWERCLSCWHVSFTLIMLFIIRIPARVLYRCLAAMLVLSALFGTTSA